MRDAVSDYLLIRREKPDMKDVAGIRAWRTLTWFMAHSFLLFISATYLLGVLQPVRAWVVILSFFGYPIMTVVEIIYERVLRDWLWKLRHIRF